MKKTISILLSLLLVLISSSLLFSCDLPDISSNDNNAKQFLPIKMSVPIDGEIVDVPFVWTENSCSFTVDNARFLFTYDSTNGHFFHKVSYKDQISSQGTLCVFDNKGRATSIIWNNKEMLSFSYENEIMKVLSCAGTENFSPIEISVDFESNKTLMPPFDNPDDYMFFTQWGDLYKGEDKELLSYVYDDYGNITSVSMADYSITFSYDDSLPITASWQKCPVKFMLIYCLNFPAIIFAMDVMCLSFYQNNLAK